MFTKNARKDDLTLEDVEQEIQDIIGGKIDRSNNNLKAKDQARKLYKILSKGDNKHKLSLTLLDKDSGWGSYYSPTEHRAAIPSGLDEVSEAIRSHELGHATGLLSPKHSKFVRNVHGGAYALSSLPLVHSGAQMFGGGVGSALSALSGLAQLVEEGQASLRGALALKKLNGKLTKRNLLGYGLSMGSYVGSNILGKLATPKIMQQIIDKGNPGFAKEHKVLLDYLS